MMSTNIEKKSAVSEQGHVVTFYGFFSGRKLGQYAGQELLKSLFQNKTPDLTKQTKKEVQRNRKERRRESNPVYLHVQATT